MRSRPSTGGENKALCSDLQVGDGEGEGASERGHWEGVDTTTRLERIHRGHCGCVSRHRAAAAAAIAAIGRTESKQLLPLLPPMLTSLPTMLRCCHHLLPL